MAETNGVPLLIVEDNPMYAEILQRLLLTLGEDLAFSPTWVDSAEKATRALNSTDYQLVLLDYQLPGANGLEILAEIQDLPSAQRPAVIMLTGMGNEEIAVQAMKSGAKDYLAKDHLDVPSLTRALRSALERRRLEAQVAETAQQLRQKNEQMETDLMMAREIQTAFLPQGYPRFPAGASAEETALHFVHRYRPTGTVGGDFLDVFRLSDDRAGVFICDVMGHGVRAALVTAIVRTLVGNYQREAGDPGRFLGLLNDRLLGILQQTRPPTFATAYFLVVDLARAKLQYASAGHPAPLHLCRETREVRTLGEDGASPGPALGVFEDSRYPTGEQDLTLNDLFILFTDGLLEVEGRNEERYGQQRLHEAVLSRCDLEADTLFDQVLEEVLDFSSTSIFHDDVCLVGVEIRGLGGH